MKNKIYSKLTYKKLEELITDLTFNSDTISIGQHCKTNGFIIRNVQDLKICNDFECKSCQEMAKSMKEAGKKCYKDV